MSGPEVGEEVSHIVGVDVVYGLLQAVTGWDGSTRAAVAASVNITGVHTPTKREDRRS